MRGTLGFFGFLTTFAIGLHLPPGASAQITTGEDVQVNTYTQGDQWDPAISAGSDGRFLMVWASDGSPGGDVDGLSIQARLYAANGMPVTGQFQVNSFATGSQYEPGVSANPTGGYVVVWHSMDGQDPETTSVRGQCLGPDGSLTGGEFVVDSFTDDYTYYPADPRFHDPVPAAGPGGEFVVVWNSDSWTQDLLGPVHCRTVRGRRMDASGAPLDDRFSIASGCTGGCSNWSWIRNAVVSGSTSQFVVVWDYSDYGLFMLKGGRYDWSGSFLGSFEVVPSQIDPNWTAGSMAAGSDRFVVAWSSAVSPGTDISGSSVLGRFVMNDGTPVGDVLQLNTFTDGDQFTPVLAHDPLGGLVALWSSDGSPGGDSYDVSIQGRRLGWDGNFAGDQFQVNSHAPGDQLRPAVDGGVAVWDSPDSPGTDVSGWSILAARVPPALWAGLAGWWQADGSPIDSSPEANHGILYGGTTFTTGVFGRAFGFDGIDGFVAVPDDDSLDMGLGDFSITFWLKTETTWRIVLDKRTAIPNRGYHVFLQDGAPGLQLKDPTGTTKFVGTQLVSDGRYHFVAITVDRDGFGRIWVDDNAPDLFDPGVRPGSLTNDTELRIGRQSDAFGGAGYMDGAIDDLRIYDRALSEDEVSYMYTPGAGVVFIDGFESGSVTMWSDTGP